MKQLLIVLMALVYAGCQSHSPNERSLHKTLMLKSYGEVETLPDMASFYIHLSCLDKSVKLSKECLVTKSNELTKQLHAAGIKEEDVLTTSVDMNKSYRWEKNTQVFEGYNSSTRMFVTVRDLNALDEIYTDLLENKNLNLGGLSYSHSKLDSLKNEAYLTALKKAGLLADKLLSELPESKKEVLQIGNVELSASVPEAKEYGFLAEMKSKSNFSPQKNAISISKGTVVVNATLFVEYLIK